MENDFTGKIAEIKFETGSHYKVEYLSNNKMKLTSFQEKDWVENEIEDIYVHKINDGQYTINWVEKDGKSISHNIDINSKRVWAFVSYDDKNSLGGHKIETYKGIFEFINSDFSKDDRPFTNLEIVRDFWERFFNKHDAKAIDDYLAPPYTQHNPHLADGIEAFRNYFVPAFEKELKGASTKIMSIISNGDLVFIHNLKNNQNSKGRAAVDIFRVKDKKIVEHWDVIQDMPETSLNDHPMF